MQLRSLIGLGALLAVLGALWWVWRGAPRTGDAAEPSSRDAGMTAGATGVPEPSAPTSMAPAEGASLKNSPAQPSERAAAQPQVTFRGRSIPQLRGVWVDFDSSGSPKMHGAIGQDMGAATDLAQAQRAWISFLQDKYSGYETGDLERSRTDLQALLDWQETGPIEFDNDRLPKPSLEALMSEIAWLQDR
jgi:hypothetical protein